MLDRDLAMLYGVTTKRLNEAVKRNIRRFPEDFMFQLTKEEVEICSRSQFAKLNDEENYENLKSQFATSSLHGGRRKLPYAFTENGAIMAANILKSKRAIRMSIIVVRTFIELRRVLLVDRELATWLRELERTVSSHDKDIRILFATIKSLIAPPEKPRRKVGFEVR